MSVINNPAGSGGGGPTGSAGGDLGGTYPNPEVASALNAALSFVSVTAGVGVQVVTSNKAAYVAGNQSATGGPGVILDNATAATSGKAMSVRSGGTELLAVGYNGHILPAGSAPTVSYASGWGTTSNVTINGSDAAFFLQFECGLGANIAATTAIFTVTLNKAYSGLLNFVAICSYAGKGSTPGNDGSGNITGDGVVFYCVPTATNQFQVFGYNSFAPTNNTYYNFMFLTMGAGATS
jgi:hypothetical protein